MELQHVNAKIYVQGDLQIDLMRFIEIFHRWTSEQNKEELLVDVADYRHVPAGPGVVLVGHDADYAMDNGNGKWGLLYNRKAALEGSNQDRLGQAFRAAASACLLLEAEFQTDGPLAFSRQEFELFINDREIAPNTPDTWAQCEPELRQFVSGLFGNEAFAMTQDPNPRHRFGVHVRGEKALDLESAAR